MTMEIATAPTGFGDTLARLALSAILGGVIGFNREMANNPAGLRTHALVALGACLFTIKGLSLVGAQGLGDPVSRIIQGIVAGIGFVGGGVIFRGESAKNVQGLTTAASILTVGAIGCATGLGLWRAAAIAAALTILILVIGGLMDRFIHEELKNGNNKG